MTVTLKVNPYSNSAVNKVPTIQVWVGGLTATQYDTMTYTNRDTRVIIPIVIGVISLLLLLYLRSLVAMVFLIGTVLLSYFATLGIGWIVLHNLMGVSPAPAMRHSALSLNIDR